MFEGMPPKRRSTKGAGSSPPPPPVGDRLSDLPDGALYPLVETHGPTFASDHLKRLQLSNLVFDYKLDFSCSPVLEVLEIDECNLTCTDKISSKSLKYLSIGSECRFAEDSRTHIYAPNLHSLRLEVGYERIPELDRMPCLVEGFVKLCADDNLDQCTNSVASGDCGDDDCFACYLAGNDSVLLQGLSEARNLALMSDVDIFIFRRDLKWGPVFGNLKTLLLNEYWCVPADFVALEYMLENSPVLEKLTLQLFCEGPESNIKMERIPVPTERSTAVSENLKIVEVKCKADNGKVLHVLKFLSDKLGINTYRFSF